MPIFFTKFLKKSDWKLEFYNHTIRRAAVAAATDPRYYGELQKAGRDTQSNRLAHLT